MNNDKHDITPGQDKFEPIDNSLLRLHIDELSQPIRRSYYAVPFSTHRRPSDGNAASLLVALAILATVGLIAYLSR